MGLGSQLRLAATNRDLAGFLVGRAERRGGMLRLRVPLRGRYWIVTNRELIDEVLRKRSDSYDKGGPIYGVINQALGDQGLFTINDPVTWRVLREQMNPAFAWSGMGDVAALCVEFLESRMKLWDSAPTVSIFDELKHHNVELLVRHLFGQRLDNQQIVELAEPVFSGMATQIFRVVLRVGSGSYRKAISEMDEKVYEVIEAGRRSPGEDLLGRLLAQPSLTDKQVRDQVFTLFMAGFDSTATALAWACIELAENAKEREALRSEVAQVLGDRAPTLSDVRRLERLNTFLRTAIERNPAFPLFFRNAATAGELGGHQIRKGDQLIIAPREAQLPFGAGKRKCIGENMATVIGTLTLAMMLQRFRHWERLHPGDRQVRFGMTAPPGHSELILSE